MKKKISLLLLPNRMKVPGQAGRWVAILVVNPLLILMAYLLLKGCTHRTNIARALICLSSIFIVYELLWIVGVLDYK